MPGNLTHNDLKVVLQNAFYDPDGISTMGIAHTRLLAETMKSFPESFQYVTGAMLQANMASGKGSLGNIKALNNVLKKFSCDDKGLYDKVITVLFQALSHDAPYNCVIKFDEKFDVKINITSDEHRKQLFDGFVKELGYEKNFCEGGIFQDSYDSGGGLIGGLVKKELESDSNDPLLEHILSREFESSANKKSKVKYLEQRLASSGYEQKYFNHLEERLDSIKDGWESVHKKNSEEFSVIGGDLEVSRYTPAPVATPTPPPLGRVF